MTVLKKKNQRKFCIIKDQFIQDFIFYIFQMHISTSNKLFFAFYFSYFIVYYDVWSRKYLQKLCHDQSFIHDFVTLSNRCTTICIWFYSHGLFSWGKFLKAKFLEKVFWIYERFPFVLFLVSLIPNDFFRHMTVRDKKSTNVHYFGLEVIDTSHIV